MCGIAGIWHLDNKPLEKEELELFTDSLSNRGPDGRGFEYLNDGTLGFGHRRLSILDLSELGKQPMNSESGRYVITYNGEVFNFVSIKRDLEKVGYHFRTNTDTEVILNAWQEWGENCLDKFNGMWAFAIWDKLSKELFLARDRFGVKPLYYLYVPGKLFAFASETRAFKNLFGFHRELDMKMLNFYINEHPVVGTGNSIFNNIKQILPGHTAKLSSLKKLVQKRWWNIKDHVNRENYPTDFNKQSEYFYELFKDACKIRLVSDVPVGTALSGGLDSSSVYSTVFSLLSANKLDRTHINSQNAFVATFPGLISDERLFAEEALQYTNGPAVFLEQNLNVSPENVISDTLKFDAISNAPITSVTNIYKGMKENGITVSLDGHAVDEMLYGYRNMMYKAYAHFLRNNRILEANNIKKSILPTYHSTQNELPINVINQINKSVNSRWGKLKYMLRNNLQKRSAESCLVHPELMNSGDPYDFGDIEFVDRIAYHETFINTLPVILRDFDRAGMMQGVEIRMPFMDWRIVSFLFSLPLEAKIANGYNKYILREAMRGRMAETIRLRKFKIGIGSPIGNWINGSLKEWALDSTQPILKSKDALTVKSADLKRIIENLQKGELNDSESQRLWLELNTQMLL